MKPGTSFDKGCNPTSINGAGSEDAFLQSLYAAGLRPHPLARADGSLPPSEVAAAKAVHDCLSGVGDSTQFTTPFFITQFNYHADGFDYRTSVGHSRFDVVIGGLGTIKAMELKTQSVAGSVVKKLADSVLEAADAPGAEFYVVFATDQTKQFFAPAIQRMERRLGTGAVSMQGQFKGFYTAAEILSQLFTAS